MMTTDAEQREILSAVIQSNPGALKTIQCLRATFADTSQYGTMVEFLFEHGPRGPRLWDRFHDLCGEDALVLGRDLLSQASELKGWDGPY